MSGWSKKLPTVATRIIHNRNVLARTNLSPSASSEMYRALRTGTGCRSRESRDRGTPTATNSAERQNVPASTKSTFAAPIPAIMAPARNGPSTEPKRATARSRAFTRSDGICARRARAGTRASFAVSPNELILERKKTSTTMCQYSSSPARCSAGIETTIAALTTSARTVPRRNPTRSTSGPPRTGTSSPKASAAPTSPVLAALPVVWRTNHGPATIVIMLPTWEMPSAVSTAYTGRRSRGAFATSLLNPLAPPASSITVYPDDETGSRRLAHQDAVQGDDDGGAHRETAAPEPRGKMASAAAMGRPSVVGRSRAGRRAGGRALGPHRFVLSLNQPIKDTPRRGSPAGGRRSEDGLFPGRK